MKHSRALPSSSRFGGLFTLLALGGALVLTASPARAASGTDHEPFINKMLSVTDRGSDPGSIELERRGSLVFFRNGTSDSLVRVEVDYGARRAYCSTGRMAMGEDGTVRSRVPLQPGGFATVCFPDPGTYPVRFFGVRGKKGPVMAQVVVR
jgi:hypothetical protein